MGIVRLRVRELAAEKGWTLKEVSDDFTALHKLARTFDVMIEDLVEIVEE
jgi:putative transcriptional regulator